MIVAAIAPRHLGLAWPDLWPLLEPAVRRAGGCAPAGAVARPDVLARLVAGEAQLWVMVDDGKPVAAVVTQITLQPEKRCLLWIVGGSRLGEWAADFLAVVEAWARAWGCVAIWGAGRSGWSRIVRRFGGARIADVDGEPAWERRIA